MARSLRLFIFARHGESVLNLERRINGDPAKEVELTERGRFEAARLGQQLSGLHLDVCLHTRFPRAARTAEIAVAGRDVPLEVEPLFDDINVGELEGARIEDYRAWKHRHARSDPFPGGESLDDAARRYAEGFRRLLAAPHTSVLVVTHEIPIRYALNAAAGSDTLDGPAHELPNAAPFLFDEDALRLAVAGTDRLVGTVPA
jgi:ribonuclease H / adenosylcobalamin/alpha-ribazole phosphatase